MGQGKQKSNFFFLLVAGGFTLFALIIAYYKVPIGVEGEWTWDYTQERSWERLLGPGVFLALYLMVVFLGLGRIGRMQRRGRAFAVLLLFILVFGLQVIAPYLWEYGAVETLVTMSSPHTTGAYFMESQRVLSIRSYLENFAERISRQWFHAAPKVNTHPPGSTLLIYATIEFLQAHRGTNAWLNRLFFRIYPHYRVVYEAGLFALGEATFVGLLLVAFFFCLFGSTALIAAYLLTKEIAGEETAYLAAAFVGLTPAIMIFSPSPDQILPALALFYSFFLVKAIRSKSLFYAFCSGLTLFIWSFFILSFPVMVALTGICLVIYFFALPGRRERLKTGFWPTLKIACAAAAGFLVPNLLLLLLRYNAFRVFWICLAQNDEFYSHFPRTYGKWVLLALPDLFLFMGIPAACIFIFGLGRAWGHTLKKRSPEITSLVLLALMAVLFILTIWGVNRGETGRLWHFLGAVGLAFGTAAVEKGRLLSRKSLLIALVLMALQLILFRLFFDVWHSQRIILAGNFG
ncbi:MAG: hypothetical protein AMS15_09105 [Planctomycetes bacterium DG_23]|nr:MAG: hypothetical protein AMS15_09105 [Planctomycetes bacterium DG_23]